MNLQNNKELRERATDIVTRFYIQILPYEYDENEERNKEVLRKARMCGLEHVELIGEVYSGLYVYISNDKYWK